MNTRKLVLVASVITFASAGAIALPLMFAANVSVPVGGTVPCNISASGAVQFANVGGDPEEQIDASATGDVTLESVATVTEDEAQAAGIPVSTDFRVVELNLNGHTDQYGDFHFNYDPDRPAPLSRVSANQVDGSFPATGDIYTNVTGTVDGLPGTYTNSTTCHMSSSNLQSFNPQENEVYTFVEDVTFTNIDPSLSDKTFTIRAGAQITVN